MFLNIFTKIINIGIINYRGIDVNELFGGVMYDRSCPYNEWIQSSNGKELYSLNFIEYIPLFGKRTDFVILIIIIPGFRKKNVSLQKKK